MTGSDPETGDWEWETVDRRTAGFDLLDFVVLEHIRAEWESGELAPEQELHRVHGVPKAAIHRSVRHLYEAGLIVEDAYCVGSKEYEQDGETRRRFDVKAWIAKPVDLTDDAVRRPMLAAAIAANLNGK